MVSAGWCLDGRGGCRPVVVARAVDAERDATGTCGCTGVASRVPQARVRKVTLRAARPRESSRVMVLLDSGDGTLVKSRWARA